MADRRTPSAASSSEFGHPVRVAVVFESSGAVYHDLMAGVTLYSGRRPGWLVHVEEAPWDSLECLGTGEVDGVIACVRNAELVRGLRSLRVPVVYVSLDGTLSGGNSPRADTCLVTGDDEAIGREGCDFLIDQGCVRVGYAGVTTPANAASLGARSAAFQRRAAERRIPCSRLIVQSKAGEAWTKVERELADRIATMTKPVGLMTYDDAVGRQVLELCVLQGISVPDSVAVVGVGNQTTLCQLSRPSLSSVNHSGRAVAYRAATILDRWMSGDSSVRRVHKVPPLGVVARLSTHRSQIGDEDVAAAMEFIGKHFSEPIQVGDVAEAVHVSRATLKRKFRSSAGRSVSEEIQRMRIERAKELLVSTRFKLEQVARQAGIGSAEHLSSLFRKCLGMTPKAFRDQMGDQQGGLPDDLDDRFLPDERRHPEGEP
jgi:LacI family transcriptional regulator